MGLAIVGLTTMLGGCAQDILKVQETAKAGDLITARDGAISYAEKNRTSEHRVIAHLELGSLHHMNNEYELSNRAFESAEKMINQIDNSPKYSFTNEFKAALTNPEEITYRGTPYDRVMASIYRGVNYAMLGNFDAARPAFINAQARQDEALNQRDKQIAEAEKEMAKDKYKAGNGNSQTRLTNTTYGNLSQFQPYEGYANPFADVLYGAFLLGQSRSDDDWGLARGAFRRAKGLVETNTFLDADIMLAGEVLDEAPNRTYVFYSAGFAPYLDQIRIDIPYFTSSGPKTVNASFPILKRWSPMVSNASVNASGSTVQVQTLADMDRIVGADFRAELPLILTRHIGSTVAKELSAAGVNQVAAATDDPWVKLITSLGTIFYKTAQNKADRRIWATLPKRIAYASFDTPEGGVITVNAPGSGSRQVSVSPEGVNIVLVRTTAPGLPMNVQNFKVE